MKVPDYKHTAVILGKYSAQCVQLFTKHKHDMLKQYIQNSPIHFYRRMSLAKHLPEIVGMNWIVEKVLQHCFMLLTIDLQVGISVFCISYT